MPVTLIEGATAMSMASKLYAILAKFGDEKPAWRQVDLARAAEMSPSAMSRTLASLTDLGVVRYDAEVGTYSLGPAIISLAGTAINQYDEFRHAYSEMHSLMSGTHLGVNLAIREGRQAMYLMHIDGPKMRRSITLIGRKIPLHCTALGKVLLSDLPDATLAEMYGAQPATAYTGHTLTSLQQLRAEVATVRRRGYATEIEELALGRGCIATAIRDRGGAVTAAMSLSGPKDAIALETNEERYAGLLLDAAERISARLGYVPSRLPATAPT